MVFKGYDKVRGRYAPSPTGELHLGNALTALISWLQVRNLGGNYLLRIEDIDRERSRVEFARQIVEDLRWIGIDWDEGPEVGGDYGPYFQSQRNDQYQSALSQLSARGDIFYCYCSRAEVARAASAPHAAFDEGPRYPSTCRDLSPEKEKALRESGQKPSVRFRVSPGRVSFHDMVFGPFEQDVSSVVGDYVLLRTDGWPSYQLAAVVDDVAMEVTDIIRGGDLINSTPRQILLFKALGARLPRFGHVPILLGPDGVRLSKRHGDITLAGLRRRGVNPEKIIGLLAGLAGLLPKEGDWTRGVRPSDLVAGFDLQKVSKTGSVVLEVEDLERLLD